MVTSLFRQAMAEAFEQLPRTYSFLTALARSDDATHVFTTESIVVDIMRGNERYAIDVVRGTGGRSNSLRRFTTKEYIPPMYDENSPISPEELLKRSVGMDPFRDPRAATSIASIIVGEQKKHQDTIIRAIEVQAANALFTGTVPLVNGDTVDYKQKATHQITVGTAWSNPAADVIGDIQGAIDVVRQDGLLEANVLILGTDSLKNFFANTALQAQANFRRIERTAIMMPEWAENGGVFHGEVTIGSHKLEVWSYPQTYEVPTGFGLPNEGTSVPYVPVDAALITSSQARFDLYFAGLPTLVSTVDTALESFMQSMPSMIAARFQPYGSVDQRRVNVEVGVRSAPLWVPTQIDGFAVLDTTP